MRLFFNACVVISVAVSLMVVGEQLIAPASCAESSVRGNLQGEGDRVRLSLGGVSKNCARRSLGQAGAPNSYRTHEIACSSDRRAAAEGYAHPRRVQRPVGSLHLRPSTFPMVQLS